MVIDEDIKVSILCLTYNHEKYIRDALQGFVNQKTNFKFEVIVHDDASTDNTQKIILEYADKYPDIIVPILQKENQHSKGKRVFNSCIFPILRGKYIAFCEGDDYWTDSNKIQLQYEMLQANPECGMCTHITKVINMKDGKVSGFFPSKRYNLCEGILDSSIQMDIIVNDFFHLNSCMFKRNDFEEFYRNKPQYARLMPVGDVPLLIHFANLAPIYFINKEMSVYRRGTEGSWTIRVRNNNEKFLIHNEKMIRALKECTKYIDSKYNGIIQDTIERLEFQEEILNKNYNKVFDKKYRKQFKKLGKKMKCKLIIKYLLTNFENKNNAKKRRRK